MAYTNWSTRITQSHRQFLNSSYYQTTERKKANKIPDRERNSRERERSNNNGLRQIRQAAGGVWSQLPIDLKLRFSFIPVSFSDLQLSVQFNFATTYEKI